MIDLFYAERIKMFTSDYKIKAVLMDDKSLNRTLSRLAHQIVEANRGAEQLVLVGILTRGVQLAERLVEKIEPIENRRLPLGMLDITFYRDDMLRKLKKPRVQETHIPFDIDGKVVVLVDDVLYTGRTVRAALDALMDFGRPARIQLAVLIDRGHRELPIKADYVGQEAKTTAGEEVRVLLKNVDGEDGVYLVEPTHEKKTKDSIAPITKAARGADPSD
jgi:pyrimidine operon attenuation protein/uracil phosphoribosyltransferase